MSDVTRILHEMDAGDPAAAERLLPLVYDELRKLAAAKLANEQVGQTLQATALVHEAYLRLVGGGTGQKDDHWNGKAHFFGAAALAMRRILVEQARRKKSLKRGGDIVRQDIDLESLPASPGKHDILVIDDALERLGQIDPQAAQLVELRYFAGLTLPQAASILDLSPRTVDRLWGYARSFLLADIEGKRS